MAQVIRHSEVAKDLDPGFELWGLDSADSEESPSGD